MTAYTESLIASVIAKNKFIFPGVFSGTKVFYSNGSVPEGWTEENAKIKIILTDTIVGRARLAEINISNPRNSKEANYPIYRRIKIVDGYTGIRIFIGRVEVSNPYYDNNYGQMLKIVVRDYSAELFERKVDRDYRTLDADGNPWGAGHPKRSELIQAIIKNYTSTVSPHAINITTYVTASGSTQTVSKNYTGSGRLAIDIIEELAKEDPWDDTPTGYGYDYYIDDYQRFHYFPRGTNPVGGPSSNGLIVTLNGAANAYTRKMQRDYTLSEQPKEVVTRVTCKGTAIDGTNVSYTATAPALETAYGITKEKIEYVWGKELDTTDLTAYCTNRANALLSYNSGSVYRGNVSIIKYPAFNRGTATIVRAGDLVRVKIQPKSIDADYVVLSVKYEEPNGFSTIELVSDVYGRAYSPLDAVSQFKSMRVGDEITIQTARINDLIVDNAKIGSCSIDKLTAGSLSVTGTIVSGGKFQTAVSPNPRIEITDTLMAGYSDATTKQFYLQASDGKAYFASGKAVLETTGLIITTDSYGSANTIFRIKNAEVSPDTIFFGWEDATTGLILVENHDLQIQGENDLYLKCGGLLSGFAAVCDLSEMAFRPTADDSVDLGMSTYKWKSIYGTNHVLTLQGSCDAIAGNASYGEFLGSVYMMLYYDGGWYGVEVVPA